MHQTRTIFRRSVGRSLKHRYIFLGVITAFLSIVFKYYTLNILESIQIYFFFIF
jgi:hypothetical protein